METTSKWSQCSMCDLQIQDTWEALQEHFQGYHRIKKDELFFKKYNIDSENSCLEKLPEVTKKLIFSYLDMTDLKNLTLVSSKLNLDVKSLDKRFSFLVARLDQDFTEFENFTVKRRDTTISLRIHCFKDICHEKLEESFAWIRSQADKITHLSIDIGADNEILRDDDENLGSDDENLGVDDENLGVDDENLGADDENLEAYDENLGANYENGRRLDINIAEKLLSPEMIFPALKKVDLSIYSIASDVCYNLINKFDPKIERLNLSNVDLRHFPVLEHLNLTYLKEIHFTDVPGISKILKSLNSSTQSLQKLEVYQNFEDLEDHNQNFEDELRMPLIQDNFLQLTHLIIDCLWNCHKILNLENLFEKCAATLTHLELNGIDTNFRSLSTKFSALKSLIIERGSSIKMSVLNDMLCSTLKYMKIYLVTVENDTVLNDDLELPFLTELAIEYECTDVSWLLLQIFRISPNLTTFKHDSCKLGFSAFDQLECNFPSLQHVHIWRGDTFEKMVNCGRGLNFFLKGCPNLRTLYLCGLKVNLDVELPHLNKLLLSEVAGSGLDKLVSSCAPSMKILCLSDTDVSVIDSAIIRGLPVLEQLNLYPRVPSWIMKLKLLSLQLPSNVQVFNDRHDVSCQLLDPLFEHHP